MTPLNQRVPFTRELPAAPFPDELIAFARAHGFIIATRRTKAALDALAAEGKLARKVFRRRGKRRVWRYIAC